MNKFNINKYEVKMKLFGHVYEGDALINNLMNMNYIVSVVTKTPTELNLIVGTKIPQETLYKVLKEYKTATTVEINNITFNQ